MEDFLKELKELIAKHEGAQPEAPVEPEAPETPAEPEVPATPEVTPEETPAV